MKMELRLLAGSAIYLCSKILYGKVNVLSSYGDNPESNIKYYLLIGTAILLIIKYKWVKGIYQKAYYDELTLAGNRTKFKKEINKLDYKRISGFGMFLDLDNFKRINDTYGHEVGDATLKLVVEKLQGIFNKKYIYRLSGDEFFILHKNIRHKNIVECDPHSTARKVVEELKKPIEVLGVEIKLSGSIGVCPIDKKIKNSSEILHRADIAMYGAKNSGKGDFVVADDKMVEEFDKYHQTEKDFINALENKEIFPYFQPKVELENEKIVGVEALARWVHHEDGFIPPSVFIPMAEKNDVIAELDFLMAESAVSSLKKWIENGIVSEDFKLSFNISVKTLERLDVCDFISKLLKKYDVSGKNIQIEITESIFINNIQKVLHEVSYLRESLGVSLALDDFTAGHASLKGLGTLGIDTLKFDRSLLQIIKDNVDKGHRIYSTLIHLSDDMGYISVAEGIEEASESEFLKKNGVKYAQGFYYGRPMPEEDLIQTILRKDVKLKEKNFLSNNLETTA